MLPGSLLSGDLGAAMIAEHLSAREHWLGGVDRNLSLASLLNHLVERVEAGDEIVLARIARRPDLGARLFALAPALAMLRIFNVIEQRDDAYLAHAVSKADEASHDVPIAAMAHARMGFLRMLNTLARVLARRVDVPDIRIPIGV